MSALLPRRRSAPVRSRPRPTSSVLESALVSLGRDDAVVSSSRKVRPTQRRREGSATPIFRRVKSVPASTAVSVDDDEDPFTHFKSMQRKRAGRGHGRRLDAAASPWKRSSPWRQSVLECTGRTTTPRTRSSRTAQRKRKQRALDNDDDDAVVVQKRLFASPGKTKPKRRRQPQQGTDASKTWTVLDAWRLAWPLRVDDRAARPRTQLVLTGRVHGHAACFVVSKRLGPRHFVAHDGAWVLLAGECDWDAASRDGVPREALDVMAHGIPAFFQTRLLPFVQQKPQQLSAHDAKPRRKPRARTKRASSSSTPLIGHKKRQQMPLKETETTTTQPSPPQQPKPEAARQARTKKRTRRVPSTSSTPLKKKKKKQKTEPEPEPDEETWTSTQLAALQAATMQIPTTAPNFWAQVAHTVPNKSAGACQAKTFEHFRSRRARTKKRTTRTTAATQKLARPGSIKFKQQVRDFVHAYEHKHVDDLFETTPTKDELPPLPDLDSPAFDKASSTDDDDSDAAPTWSSNVHRNTVDSYVRGLHRRQGVTNVRHRPPSPIGRHATKNKAWTCVQTVGDHAVTGHVSPGGTMHVSMDVDESSLDDDESSVDDEV
ncbi:hypothetical protein PsorP6_000895 [Peronosclerospora sorghi]|uniref:Uncharacterized protein n=1 Tax=Peronosclerospora sorghi TaxID=230839 RepID=A0ACC0WWT0_9STRA|nr:hypothetical protein PsorP6_000895 [Peronosclerospora sorghi]